MALDPITIVTPDNLKVILKEVLNQYTTTLDDKLVTVITESSNSVTLTTDTTNVNIGISGFDKSQQLLHVYKDNVLVDTGYTVSSDSLSVTFSTAITATTEAPVTIKFIAIKASLSLKA